MATVNQTRSEYHFRAMRKGREHERAQEGLLGGFGMGISTTVTASWKSEISAGMPFSGF